MQVRGCGTGFAPVLNEYVALQLDQGLARAVKIKPAYRDLAANLQSSFFTLQLQFESPLRHEPRLHFDARIFLSNSLPKESEVRGLPPL